MRRGSTCIVVAVDVNDSFVLRIRPWTWLKVSQQLRGRRTWFKAGTISRGIALRLTSAGPLCACAHERQTHLFDRPVSRLSLSLFALSSFPPSFSKILSVSAVFASTLPRNVGRVILPSRPVSPSDSEHGIFSLLDRTRWLKRRRSGDG